jgi:hypothetical protein
MPNPEHVEILRRGPKVWKAWREQNPSVIPNLSGTTLKSGDRQVGPLHPTARGCSAVRGLSAADLRVADMSDATEIIW